MNNKQAVAALREALETSDAAADDEPETKHYVGLTRGCARLLLALAEEALGAREQLNRDIKTARAGRPK